MVLIYLLVTALTFIFYCCTRHKQRCRLKRCYEGVMLLNVNALVKNAEPTWFKKVGVTLNVLDSYDVGIM